MYIVETETYAPICINVARNMVFYSLPFKDHPSYSYWMIPGTWNE